MKALFFALLLLQTKPFAFENDFARVSKNAAPCADAARQCGERIIVALADVQFQAKGRTKQMKRGDIEVFNGSESYLKPVGGDYLEVVIKASHPPSKGPEVEIAPQKNNLLYDGKDFFIFEEKLDVGDIRPRHSHAQRLVVVINDTKLQQWPEGKPEITKDEIPNDIHFNDPVIHTLKNIGLKPLRNIVIEFKPAR